MSKKKKKNRKKSKSSRNKKIAIGTGIVVGTGALAFLGYKYFNPIKDFVSSQFNRLDGKNESGEKLSDIKEFAELGITEKDEQRITQTAGTLVKLRDHYTATGNTQQAAAAQQSIEQQAQMTLTLTNPQVYIDSCEGSNEMRCQLMRQRIAACNADINSAECAVFRKTDVGKLLFP
ncbi:hypothetical protein [Bernardetia sp.]|uniref:hypothetical protein n=1 Tax=Bernardetia sp. TaxID=1937974 RepID=UPI0025C567E8|nr:hypothetical protein [Bernardetia sp.]